MEISVEQEIQQIEMQRPHVVILGAGASLAAFPNGDANGVRLPLMNNFVETLGLQDLLTRANIPRDLVNFEEIYNHLYREESQWELREELEQYVYRYFSSLEIPETPTIYDHLLLGLRSKDVVATFNWDPFLLKAFRRNAQQFDLPRLLFLHGNVGVGFCETDKVAGVTGNICSRCGDMFSPTQLLYPISEKNYHQDGFISSQWAELHHDLKNAFMLTVFGYGAPASDVSAVELMKVAWGDVYQREMEQTEIIDIKSEDDLYETWKPFIHSHHYDTYSSFYKSRIANHPRRTGEAFLNQFVKAQFTNDNPVPRNLNFQQLWEWFNPLKQVENGASST